MNKSRFTSRHCFVVVSGLLVAAPVAWLSGCGGGSSALQNSQTTQKTLSLAISATQKAVVKLSLRGDQATGTLSIPAEVTPQVSTQNSTQKRAASSVPFSFPSGNFPISGRFSPPRGVSMSGQFPAPIGSFSFDAQIPDNGNNGSWTITVDGETTSGDFSGNFSQPTPTVAPTGTPAPTLTARPSATPVTPTATPRPTVAPSPTALPNAFQATAQFSSKSSDLSARTFDFAGTLAFGSEDGNAYSARFTQPLPGTGNRFIDVTVVAPTGQKPKAGDVFPIGTTGFLDYSEVDSSNTANWVAKSGSLRVTQYSTAGVKIEFAGVALQAAASTPGRFSSGSFTFAGKTSSPLK